MSQKNQPRCVVAVEPLNKVQEEKMENSTKESSKKRSKDEKNVIPTKDIVPAESTSNGQASATKETEKTSGHENGVSINGKSSKKDKSKSDKSSDKGPVTNGVSDVALNSAPGSSPGGAAAASAAEGAAPDLNPDIIEEDALVQHPEPDNDELFPELNYDENSDTDNFETASPNFSPVGRSATRRSQAKKIPTPETPQLPASKSDTPEVVEISPSPSRNTPDQTTPLREKVFKMKDIYTPMRVSPAPDSAKKTRDTNSPAADADKDEEHESKNGTHPANENGSAKTDTNFSKSRIKVSPYRRSSRISDQFSIMANYSGNNTTQQTELIGDISSSSPAGDADQSADCSATEKSLSDSFKNIKGRRSYRHLREISFRNLSAQRHLLRSEDGENRENTISSVNATAGSSPCDTVSSETSTKWTPVGHVVGRKRRPDSEDPAPSAEESLDVAAAGLASKRARLLGYVATPLRHLRDRVASSTPIHFTRSYKAEPLLAPTTAESVTVEEEMPAVADIVPLKEGGPEHKWCSVM